MNQPVSIAIETTCRAGGIALGAGDELVASVDFNASSRHATHLVARLAEMVRSAALAPGDVEHLYVSAGPGSFTGTRVGITVARTLAQAVAGLRCVAVPTPHAVAEATADLKWQHLAVILDARESCVFAQLFRPGDAGPQPDDEGQVCQVTEFLDRAPRPLLLAGEGLEHHDLSAQGVTASPMEYWLPTARGVWQVGRRLARAGRFTEAAALLPHYVREPEAVRLWDKLGRP